MTPQDLSQTGSCGGGWRAAKTRRVRLGLVDQGKLEPTAGQQRDRAWRQTQSCLTDAFQEGQSSLSERGRDELASLLWPRVPCHTVSYSQIRVDNQLLL